MGKKALRNVLLSAIFAVIILVASAVINVIALEINNLLKKSAPLSANIKVAQNKYIDLEFQTSPDYPKRLEIPSLKISAQIQPVGTDKDGKIATVGGNNVAWFKSSPKPGEPGNAILNGHLDTKISPDGVFKNLNQIKIGDQIKITDKNNRKLTFLVTRIEEFDRKEKMEKIFQPNVEKNLILITCSGKWLKEEKTYSHRLLVFAELI